MMYLILISLLTLVLISCIRIVKTDHRGVVERFGKVINFIYPGYHLIVPLIDQVQSIYIGEQELDSPNLYFQTSDNKSVNVDVKIFYHLKSNDQILIRSLHEINNYPKDINIALQSSLSKIIGDLPLSSINQYRLRIKLVLFSMIVSRLNLLDIEIDRVEVNQKFDI